MALRKALAYSKKHVTPYTRKSTSKNKNYIKTVPPVKISKFQMGDLNGYKEGKYNIIIKLCSGEDVLIRDNALEAARQYVNKELEKNSAGQFYFELKVHPHHIIRENKTLTGAGADRMSKGMQHSFGTTIGRGAIVKKDKEIFLVATNNEKVKRIAIDALEKIKAKIPCHARIVLETKNK
ncbi:MAG: 50S ribosomal protein L16 [Candidatus Pacearchaeota archaeon]